MKALNRVWSQYITSALTDKNGDEISKSMFSSDLHGAKIEALSSSNPTLVGIDGIILQETINIFRIVSTKNKIHIIPKKGTIFQIFINAKLSVKVIGSEFVEKRGNPTTKFFSQ